MKLNETKKVDLYAFSFDSEPFKGNAEVQISENRIQQVNGTIYKDGAYSGSFSSQPSENGELRMNINGVSAENISAVAEVVKSLVEDVKANYIKVEE